MNKPHDHVLLRRVSIWRSEDLLVAHRSLANLQELVVEGDIIWFFLRQELIKIRLKGIGNTGHMRLHVI